MNFKIAPVYKGVTAAFGSIFSSPDGEEQDAYIIGINYPLNVFIGEIIAIIHRKNDIEDKWVVAPKESKFTKQQIIDATKFQEKFFDSEVIVI